jgi:hypothetical protein
VQELAWVQLIVLVAWVTLVIYVVYSRIRLRAMRQEGQRE